mmetsp:Transcript_16938/g.46654  ORF Transcript_16938/g.46654 Transcript_16938/m.46654 type:complete len:355 (-) Transcript_16938:181-1245(-)
MCVPSVPRWLCRWWFCWKWSREQRSLRGRLLERDDFSWSLPGAAEADGRRPLRLIGGMDISFFADPQSPGDARACAALVVCELDPESGDLAVVWERYELVELTAEYIPGFLAFREVGHLRALVNQLRVERPELLPDVVLVDGNGVLHPRGFGCASHLGVVCDLCTVGVGKDLHMVDGLDRDEVKRGLESVGQGGHVELVGQSGRVWGAALLPQPLRPVGHRNQAPPKNPIYVSVGHRISLETSVALVERLCISARVPEPVRLADIRSRELVRKARERERAGVASKDSFRQKKKQKAPKDKVVVAAAAVAAEAVGEPSGSWRVLAASTRLPAGLLFGLGGLAVAALLLRARRQPV